MKKVYLPIAETLRNVTDASCSIDVPQHYVAIPTIQGMADNVGRSHLEVMKYLPNIGPALVQRGDCHSPYYPYGIL